MTEALSKRDQEIVDLAVSLGTSRRDALRRLTGKTPDEKDKLLARLRTDKTRQQDKATRERQTAEGRRWADEGRSALAREVAAHEREVAQRNRGLSLGQRIERVLGQMRFHEPGPVRAQTLSHTAGRGGGEADRPPPGVDTKDVVTADHWTQVFERVIRVAEHELELLTGRETVLKAVPLEQRILGIPNPATGERTGGLGGERADFICYISEVSWPQFMRLLRKHRDEGWCVRKGRLVQVEVEDVEEAA
jgi:hypothetical protein